MKEEKMYKSIVKGWILIGVIMVFVQILLGGITRLTGSGLSITKWEIVTGVIPPITIEDWSKEYNLYRETPQYKKINKGMTIGEFKFIFFWEYMHRLWARLMGFVFFFPFVFFIYKKWIDKLLNRKLLSVVGIAVVVASFGWIMVASGLINRPWVNAYKLTIHLNLGILLFGVLLNTYMYAVDPKGRSYSSNRLNSSLKWIFGVLVVQLLLGGLMSGMKAGIYFPSWPNMNGQLIPDALLNSRNWTLTSFVEYDSNVLAPALIHFLHRMTGYILFLLILSFSVRVVKLSVPDWYKWGAVALIGILCVQIILGILTVINCRGQIPLALGVLHQAGAILLLGVLLYMMRGTNKK